MKKVISILTTMLLLCFPAYSQDVSLADSLTEQKSKEIKIHFDHNSCTINLDIQKNRESLLHFSDLIEKLENDTLSVISKIEINSYTSPDGGRIYNKNLSEKRSNSIYDYLTRAISVPDSLITMNHSGTNWNGLQKIIEGSDLPYRDEVLYILKNVPEETWRRVNPNDRWLSLVDSRNKHLIELKYGAPYRDMVENIYPQLRNGSIVTIYFKTILPPPLHPKVIEEIVEVTKPDTLATICIQPIFEPVVDEKEYSSIKFAIKTNLLYDMLLTPSIELEVPIGECWSVAGEWIFPWWGNDTSDNAVQLLNGNLEAKYWLGDRAERSVLTGWYAGVYTGGGLYDFRRDSRGYIGEFFIAAGVSGGYAHTINKSGNLRMEYSVGIGFLQTDYRYYIGEVENQYWVRQYNGSYTWIGPTRAKVSLSWLLNSKKWVR